MNRRRVGEYCLRVALVQAKLWSWARSLEPFGKALLLWYSVAGVSKVGCRDSSESPKKVMRLQPEHNKD
jgi:hypothetical protein